MSNSSTGVIGFPLDTVSCFVIEPADSADTTSTFNILPRGEVGELAVGGNQLAEGYLNRPEQTSSAFISTQYGRVYRTGDKARLLADGTLECLGRLSEGQVKLRGQRIELGEIEKAILRTDGCHNAVAAVVDSSLVAFCAADATLDEESILAHCRQWLPQFMVPGECILMSELPRLSSGKVDKKKLQAEFREQKQRAALAETPALMNDTEEAVMQAVSDIIERKADLQATLASAGIDSLNSIKLASTLREKGFEISASRLLSSKTFKHLCSSVKKLSSDTFIDTGANSISLLAELNTMIENNHDIRSISNKIVDALPCTPLQSAMLAETNRRPDFYCNEIELKAEVGITTSALSEAFCHLAQQNEILRSVFFSWNGEFITFILNKLQEDQIRSVTAFERGFTLSKLDEIICPLQIQLKEPMAENDPVQVLIQIHHAIYDGWSLDMMLSDLSTILKGATPSPRRQFRDVLQFQRCAYNSKLADPSAAFWSQYLLHWNKQPFPKLDHRLETPQGTFTTSDILPLNPGKVQEKSKDIGISPQVLFQAAAALVWSGVLGASDIVIGCVTSGRSIPVTGIDEIVGPCIASLPLRVNFEQMVDSNDLLGSIHSSNRAFMDHCVLPLSDIKKVVNSRDALYDILFVYQESLASQGKSNNLVRETYHIDHLETKLLVEVEPREHEFKIQLTYHSEAFAKGFVSCFLQQYANAINQLFHHHTEKLSRARANVGGELSIYNPVPQAYDGIPDLAKHFELIAEESPEVDAICFAESLTDSNGTTTMTYKVLNESANRSAHFIRSFNLSPGQVVGIVMEKSIDLYISILAIVKAGCAYLPISPSTPVSRIQEILDQASAKYCLVDQRSSQVVGAIGGVNFIETSTMDLRGFSHENLGIKVDSSRLAYVIYTSGTTGVPKGVAVTQMNIVSNIQHLKKTYPLSDGKQSRLLQACSQAFDVSVFEIFFTWLTGSCLCTATNEVLLPDLEHAIRELYVTHLSLTPTVASLIRRSNVPNVEFIVTAGEPMTQSVLENWGNILWQGYGPSETTNICSVKRMAPNEYIEHLGWVFPNTSVFVMLPESLEPAPRGWVGEFCFGGDQVAYGYLNQPDITAEKFLVHPSFGRIYRSGDMGRMLPDGSLVILGRIDGQIKLRGNRIETVEVDSQITTSGLATAAVTVVVSRQGQSTDQLATFYVPVNREQKDHHGALLINSSTNRELFSRLQMHLPSYMVPSYLIPVDSIPLTPTGKVDRRRLQAVFETRTQDYLETASLGASHTDDDSDWSQRETEIAEVIAEALGENRLQIKRWTPFAAIGLDSISAMRVSRALSSRFAQHIPASAILQNPTVALLSRYFNEAILDSQHSTPASAKQETCFFSEDFVNSIRDSFLQFERRVGKVLPCTPLQEAMLSSGKGTYVNKVLLRIRISPESMRSYWDVMCHRHEILRTCFITTNLSDQAIVQVVLDHWEMPWRVFDADNHSLDEMVDEHVRSMPDPLDSKDPPVSLAFLHQEQSVFLSFICHHSLYDGVAIECLFKEIEYLVHGANLLPPLTYDSFLMEISKLPSDWENFWSKHFDGFRPSLLTSSAASRQIDQRTKTGAMEVPLSEILDQAKMSGVSLLALCQTAWANVLAACHDTMDVCFGNVVGGRTLDIEGLERLVAPCFNTLPVRVDMSAIRQNHELVKQLDQFNRDLIPYQFTPLRSILKSNNVRARRLFDTILLLQQPPYVLDETIWTLEEDSGDMDVPIVCEMVPCPQSDSLVLHIHHDVQVVTEATAAELLNLCKYFLQKTLASPYACPIDKDLLPAGSRAILQGLETQRDEELAADQTVEAGNLNNVEIAVREVLSDLSGVPRNMIHRNTTIFKLGLDSINAVQVASMLRQQGHTISASEIIELSSCEKISSRLLSKANAEKAPHATYDLEAFTTAVSAGVKAKSSNSANIEAIIPCTPMQSAMISSFIQSEGHQYLNLMSYELNGTTQTTALIEAWKFLHNQHPMLRTAFTSVQHRDSTYAMVRYKPNTLELPLEVFDHEENSMDTLSEWQKTSRSTLRENMDLPLWKVAITDDNERRAMHILIHHALYDAKSLEHILDGLAAALEGDRSVDFEEVERGLAAILGDSRSIQKDAEEFWKQKASSMVINKFPILTPLREDDQTMTVEDLQSSMLLSQMQAATQELGVSIQAALHAAWTRVLATYLGESSVVFGVAVSGRTTDETQNAPFPCLNTIPVIAQNISSNLEMMNAAIEYISGMHKFQFSPLNHVQKWLGYPANAIFDTLLAFQKTDHEPKITRPWRLVNDQPIIEYPISLEIVPDESDNIFLRLTFLRSIIPQEQATLLLQQFDSILQHLICKPEESEDDLYKSKPNLFAITPPSSPIIPAPVRYLHEFVEQGAVEHPEKIAFEFVNGFEGEKPVSQSWNYRELNQIGNKVANLLLEIISPGSIVAIHFDKCPEAYFSILGILKAGCSFVALDPTAPGARKEFILQDSQSPCVLTNQQTVLDFEIPCRLVRIAEADLHTRPATKPHLNIGTTPQSTCYCLYTSGTTGTPKGCEITHDNAVQAMMAFQELFRGHWDEDSRCLQFASLHFDVSVLEQYWSWSVGIRVVSATKDLILDDLTASINRLGITHIDLTPSLARLVHPDEVPSLCKGVFITGGEQLKQEILDIWGPRAVIYNAYGPTEATIGVTMYQRVPINGRPSNIGKQFPNVGSYVFREGTEVPVLKGGVGELCVSGKLVGKGYLNRPQLTEERFPTLAYFGERIYRTGDLVRILHDGCFDFLGRADDQVKLRGQRLEIGEINHVIRTNVQDIQDVATIVTRHASAGNDVLVTFIVGIESRQDNLQIIPDEGLAAKAKAACRAYLPKYMEPTYFLRLPYIPLSPNNKAEFKILKSLFNNLTREELMALTVSKGRSSGLVNRAVFETIIRTLALFNDSNATDINDDTNIFDLGVDSITALQLSKMLKDQGLKNASTATILRNPIVGDLTQALTSDKPQHRQTLVHEAEQKIYAVSHRYRGFVCKELAITPADIEYIAPCSPLQQGMVSKALTSARGAYFNTFKLMLDDAVPTSHFKDAWDRLVSAQAILRTCFINTTDGPIQVALKHSSYFWQQFELDSDCSAEEFLVTKRGEWINSNTTHITAPFQIIHVEGKTENFFVLHIFHGLYDGNSFDLMMDQLATEYKSQHKQTASRFLDALKYGPLWKHDYCKPFWVDHLRGWAPLQMMGLFAPSDKATVMANRTISLHDLEGVRRRHGVTLQSVVLAGWVSVLRTCFANEPTLGVVVSGRSMESYDASDVVGPLFNTLPLFCGNLSTTDWASLIGSCHDFSTTTLMFQHVALQSIQKWCSNGKSLFDILFTFQIESRRDEIDVPWTIEDGVSIADYPLALEAIQTQAGKLQLSLVAQGQFIDDSKLEELLKLLEEAYTSMLLDPQSSMRGNDSNNGRNSEQQYSDESQQTSETSSDDFGWTEEADTIYSEISNLCGLTLKDVSSSTTMTELGMDSIDVIKLSTRLRQKGLNIPASLIMREQSIARICQAIQRQETDEENFSGEEHLQELKISLWEYVASTGADMDQIETVLPPTALQESMVASMLESDFDWYFNHDILELDDEVDMEHLQEAWKRVVEESQILRTGFYEVNAPELDMAYCQVVAKESSFISEVEMTKTDDISNAIEQAKEEARQHGGKSHLFQIRFTTIGLRRLAIVSIAHALYDGWSLNLMYEALEAAYEGMALVTRSPSSFIVRSLASRTDEARRFWANYLEGAQPTKIPEKEVEPPMAAAIFRHEKETITSLLEIQAFCRAHSISLQTLCQASWALVLAQKTRSLDVTFGVVLSGRDIDGAEDLMFPTINTVALRCILHGSASDFLSYLEESMADIRQFQAFPLRKAQLAAKVSGQDLFNSLFMLQKSHSQNSQKRLMTSVDGGFATLDYPVCVEAEASGDKLIWRVACQSKTLSAAESEELITEMNQAMDFMLSDAAANILSWSDEGVSIGGQPYLAISQDLQDTPTRPEDEAYSGEWDSTSRTIQRILSQTSGVEEDLIHLSTNLYELGLDSITAIKASSLLRKEGVNLKPRDILKAQDIQHMALLSQENKAVLQNDSKIEHWQPPSEINADALLTQHSIAKEDVEMVLPAVPTQVYMLGVWQNTDGAVYFPEFCYHLNGEFSQEQLDEAWIKLVKTTPMLRTCFVATTHRGIPMVQIIVNPSAAEKVQSMRLVHFQARQETRSSGWTIVLKIHHALYDGVSLSSLIGEYLRLLQGGNAQTSNGLMEWANYCTTACAIADPESTQMQMSWMEDYEVLSPWESTSLRTASLTDRVSYLKKAALPDVSSMRKCAVEWQVSVQSVFLMAYAMALWRHSSKQQDAFNIMFGLYLANRTDNADMKTTYPTLRLIPFGVQHDGSSHMSQIALHIQRSIADRSKEDTRLWEMEAHTGKQITSFVNFLSLPDMGTESPRQKEESGLVLSPVMPPITDNATALAWRDIVGEVPIRHNLPVQSHPPRAAL